MDSSVDRECGWANGISWVNRLMRLSSTLAAKNIFKILPILAVFASVSTGVRTDAQHDVSPIAKMGFRLLDGCGSVVQAIAGRTTQVRGYTTFESLNVPCPPGGVSPCLGVQGWTQVIEVFSDDLGQAVCLSVDSTEKCNNDCKERLIGEPILRLIDETAFVSQLPTDSCDLGSAIDPYADRTGFIDATFMKIGDRLPEGYYRTLPFTVDVHVPLELGAVEDPPSITVRLEYSGNLRGGGSNQNTTVSFRGQTIRRPSNRIVLGTCQFTVQPIEGGSRHGDANLDGFVDFGDSIEILKQLFLGNPSPCDSFENPGNVFIMDIDGSDKVDFGDALRLLVYLFLGGDPPTGPTGCHLIEGCRPSCRLE